VRRPTAVAAAAALALTAGPARAGGLEDPWPAVTAASYLVEVDGRPLWGRAPDQPRAPASLTKIMTALLVLERGWAPGALLTVSRRAARETGSRLGLRPGEQLTARDALRAMLLGSANDACLALAEHAAGSAEAFVARMNRRAAELGLAATRFQDPCGHDHPAQRSSARDLLRLTRAALAQREFRLTVGAASVRLATRGGRSFSLENRNLLVGRVAGARGVKTGYTPGAGKCVLVLAERGGVEVLAVLLGAPDRFWNAAGLVDLAFEASGG
jgi:D-alanyl-D-alanine carboxypeptidase (penicillin-binding protein 5/6)